MSTAGPRRVLTTLDGVVLVVGLVLGAGIFRAPPVIAANVTSDLAFVGVWVLGGGVSLLGALCYAELASTYPHAGGEYHFIKRAYGRGAGFLCAWSRMTVIQTGSIALLAFVVGDYLAPLLTGGAAAPLLSATVAAVVVVALTALNALGLRQGQRAQYLLTGLEVAGLLAVAAAGLLAAGAPAVPADALGAPAPAAGSAAGAQPAFGLAMVFVLLTFGGWSEAAYLSAELRDRRRGVVRTLTWGLAAITLFYLAANAGYLLALGLSGVAASEAVAADVLRPVAGPAGATLVSLIVIVAALSSANATMITGARGSYALGRDVALFGFLGRWRDAASTPARALVTQGLVSLVLVAFGAVARGGFEAMVAYTAPVFWLILLATGLAVPVLRRRDPGAERPFRVPFFPLTPLLFCAVAVYMLYSSVAYAGAGALVGVAVMLAGIPLFLFARSRAARHAAALPVVP